MKVKKNYMKEIQAEELKKIELNLLKKIDAICKNQGWKYALCGGTLLGAVRHKGFIPWDDDIDVAMPRKDYDEFLEFCDKNGQKYDIQTVSYKTVSNYTYLSSKICDSNTVIEEENFKRDANAFGVYVDIFPIDGLGDKKDAERHFNAMWLNREILVACNWKNYFRSKTHSWYVEPIRFLIFLLSRFVSPQQVIKKVEDYYSKYLIDKCEYGAIVCGSYWKKEIMPEKVLNEFEEIEFEKLKFMAFKNYDYYLKNIYGDYMKLPPIDKQVTHHMFKAYWKE